VKAKKTILTDDGELSEVHIMPNDITHIQAMREWQAFIESATWGMTIGEMENRTIRLANPAYARMHGYTVEELLDVKADVMYAPDSRASLSYYVECLRKDKHVTFECGRLRKDGSTFPAIVDISIVDGIDIKSAVMVSVRDITNLKRAQSETLQIKNQLQATLEAIPDLLFEMGLDGRYLDVHSSRHELLAAPAEVLLGKTVHDALPAEAADAVISALREAYEKETSFGKQIKLPLPQGDTWFELSVSRKSSNPGQEPSFIMLSRDISERKKLENELVESRKLLRELAEKTESLREEERKRIAREVHDELGQILTALRMDVALINLRFGGQNAELLSKTEGMSALLDRAGWCVRDIVSNLRPTALDMGIVAAMRWLCGEYAAHTGSVCVLHSTEESIELDEDRTVAIFRIVQELLTNAARHAEANNVKIVFERHDDDLHIQVQDDGKGFDPAVVATKNTFGLLGIGERAIALDGSIGVVSAPNQGTSVSIRVPVKPKRSRK
jgi:PAS domain S-box-containing protein